ncbi:hypothetical protein Anas_09813 [Armadillidium nasatum]|uniref:Uncharacterized protein n=1 Tax=Armadillidium nasatum TaxID=96803 RepID=A0A5N5SPW5_9CRUS|nr:hypothetical protein Anas_09813 [Armadillidium nasatum]
MNVRSSLYTRATKSHEHEYGEEVYHPDEDEYSKTCKTCDYSYRYDKIEATLLTFLSPRPEHKYAVFHIAYPFYQHMSNPPKIRHVLAPQKIAQEHI